MGKKSLPADKRLNRRLGEILNALGAVWAKTLIRAEEKNAHVKESNNDKRIFIKSL